MMCFQNGPFGLEDRQVFHEPEDFGDRDCGWELYQYSHFSSAQLIYLLPINFENHPEMLYRHNRYTFDHPPKNHLNFNPGSLLI